MSSRSAASALCALIRQNFAGGAEVQSLAVADWASATFIGARHRVRVSLAGPGAVGAAADFLGDLGERDLPIPGHIVADIVLLAQERGDDGCYVMLELEALTIEES